MLEQIILVSQGPDGPECTPDIYEVPTTGTVDITWRIDDATYAAGWRFPRTARKAIRFPVDVRRQFRAHRFEAPPGQPNRVVTVTDLQLDDHYHDYEVVLERGGEASMSDPSVKNRAGGSFAGNDRIAAAVTAGVIAGAAVAGIVYIALDDD